MKRLILYLTFLSVAITLSGGYLMSVVAIPCVLYTARFISFKEMVKFCYYREFYKFITKD